MQTIIAFLIAIFLAPVGSIHESNPSFSGSTPLRVDLPEQPRYAATDQFMVLQGSPVDVIGKGHERKEVTVLFSHPVVALKALERETKGVFTINPPMPGKFRWYGSRICAFIPDRNWQPETDYRISVPAKTRSLAGAELSKEYSFGFRYHLQPIRINGVYPGSNQNISYRPTFTIRFSFDIDPEKIKKYLQISSEGKSYPFHVRHSYPGNESNLTLQLDRDLPRDSLVLLKIFAGLPAKSYPTVLAETVTYRYKTYGPMSVRLTGNPKYFQDLYSQYIYFSNPVNIREALQKIKITPSVPLQHSQNGSSQYIYLYYWNMAAGKEYTISVEEIKDIYGNSLRRPEAFRVVMPDYRPYLSAPTGNYVLESGLNAILGVELVNQQELDISVIPYSLQDIRNHLDQKRWPIEKNLPISYQTWQPGLPWNEAGFLHFDLKKYISSNKGWYYVEFRPRFQRENATYMNQSRKSYIQITNIGISAKESAKDILVWTHALTSGEALQNTEISLFYHKTLKGNCVTNSDGFCRIAKKGALFPSDMLLVARRDADRAYISIGEHQAYSDYYYSFHEKNSLEPQYQGIIVFDRKLYRPGDKVSLKAILSSFQLGESTIPAGEQLTIEIANSTGQSVFKEKRTVSAQGGLWTEWKIPADAPLGHYRVSINAQDQTTPSLSDSFQVEEFKPAVYSVNLQRLMEKKVYETLEVKIHGEYLFGAPMQNSELSWNAFLSSFDRTFSSFPQFQFNDDFVEPSYYHYRHQNESTGHEGYYSGGSGQLDTSGNFSAQISLKPKHTILKFQNNQESLTLSSPYQLRISATVKNVDASSVTKTGTALIKVADHTIGMNISEKYLHFSRPFALETVLVNHQGSPMAGKQLDLYLIRTYWKTIQIKGASGVNQWRNTRFLELIRKERILSGNRPIASSLKTPKAGEYWIIVHDPRTQQFSRTNIYAYGGADFSGYRNDDSLSLTPDKEKYLPGETAKILIKSPYATGKAILTIERAKVYSHQIISWDQHNKVIPVPIKKEYFPSVYFSVVFIKPREEAPASFSKKQKHRFYSADAGRPRFKMGIVNLQVQDPSFFIPLSLQTDKEIFAPGEKITVRVKTAPGSEVVLAAADEGVLDLIQYQFTNPSSAIYQNWPLQIRMLENRRFLLKQYLYNQKGDRPGGGGDDGSSGSKLGGFSAQDEDGARKDFRYTAYWNPAILADADGNATVTFQLPDNLTTFRLSAISSHQGRYNLKVNKIRVRKQLMIQPVSPRFLRPGDQISLGGVIHNQTGSDLSVAVSLQSPWLQFNKGHQHVMQIKPGIAQEITFPAKLNLNYYNKQGAGYKVIRGLLQVNPVTQTLSPMDKIQDKVVVSFPVIPHQPVEAFSIAGFTNKSVQEGVVLPKAGESIQSYSLTVQLAPTALLGLERGFRFFESNPYFCLEQRASAFLLAITSGNLLQSIQKKIPAKDGYNFAVIEKLFLGEVKEFQNYDGGFRLWKESQIQQSSPYLTAYVVQVMQWAQKFGYRTDSRVMQKAYRYLQSYTAKNLTQWKVDQILEISAMIYEVLARAGKHPDQLENFLSENLQKMSLRAQATFLLGLQESRSSLEAVQKQIWYNIQNRMAIGTQHVELQGEDHLVNTIPFYTRGSAIGQVIRAMIQEKPDHPYLASLVQYAVSEKGHLWYDSHSTGHLALALFQYFQKFDKTDQQIQADVAIAATTILQHTFVPNQLQPARYELNADQLKEFARGKILPFTISNRSQTGRLYYLGTLSYQLAQPLLEARDEGFEIHRHLFPVPGASSVDSGKKGVPLDPGQALERGALHLVRMSVINTKSQTNVVIIDPLPANAEVVNTGFQVEDMRLGDLLASKNDQQYTRYEYRDDKVVITADFLYPGVHHFYYILRPTIPGVALFPGAEAKAMYAPEVFGRTKSSSFVVR